MELYPLFGFLLILLGVAADQYTTLYGLRRKIAKVGLDKALEEEWNPIAREEYRRHGLRWGTFFYKELVGGWLVALFVFLVSPPWIKAWSVFFIAFGFVGVAVNNVISILFEFKNFWVNLITKTAVLSVIALLLFYVFQEAGFSPFESTVPFSMPFIVFCAMIYFKFFSKTFQKVFSEIKNILHLR